MKRLIGSVVLMAFVLILPVAFAEEAAAVAKAKEAATAWLALVDAGKYAESWDAAAPMLKSKVTKEDWEKAANSVRGALGAVKSRTQRSAKDMLNPPNAPEGEYVTIVFDTEFATRSGVETITPTLDKDGVWRIAGYSVR